MSIISDGCTSFEAFKVSVGKGTVSIAKHSYTPSDEEHPH